MERFVVTARSRAAVSTTQFFCVALLAVMIGCSGRPRAIRPPKLDAAAVGTAAVEQYDTDGNGLVDGGELDTAPSLRFALDRIDANADGKIAAGEIEQFVQTNWKEEGSGIIRVRCSVVLGGRPLDGATIKLEPEEFMQGAVSRASGVSRGGFANIDVSDEDRPHPNAHGVQPGLYLVRITKQENGKETIPAKYNKNTTLGCEVAYRASYMPGPIVFNLQRR